MTMLKFLLSAALAALSFSAFAQPVTLTTSGVQTVTGAKSFTQDKLCVNGATDGKICFRTSASAGTTPFNIGTGGTLGGAAWLTSLTVRDTPTVVNPVTLLIFANGTVTDSGGGAATVSGLVPLNGAGGTPTSLTGTNITGTASGLTAGNVTTNANLTGDVTSSGNATTLATVNGNVGSFTNSSITVNGKGLITAASSGAAGATLAANTYTGMQTWRAGTTSASTAPMKFVSGPLNSAAEAGAVEFLTDKWYGTITTSAARKEFALVDAALTSGRIPFVTTNGRLVDASGFTWSGSAMVVPGTITSNTNSAGGLATSGTSAGNISITAANASTGTGAGTQLALANSANSLYLAKLSTGYTTNGLLTAGQAYWYNETGTSLFANAAATNFVWSRGGFDATNEVMALGAGALSLGVNGTTGGSLVIRGSTSGSATLSADAAAGSGTLTFGSSTATFSGSVTDSKGELRILPQNSQSAAYTTVLADSGKHLLHPSADTTARVFTIDSNANVAYPIGTMLTIVNQNAAGVLTISITSDTMRLAGAGTTGSRTMAANCVATALKIVATEWIISGGSCLS